MPSSTVSTLSDSECGTSCLPSRVCWGASRRRTSIALSPICKAWPPHFCTSTFSMATLKTSDRRSVVRVGPSPSRRAASRSALAPPQSGRRCRSVRSSLNNATLASSGAELHALQVCCTAKYRLQMASPLTWEELRTIACTHASAFFARDSLLVLSTTSRRGKSKKCAPDKPVAQRLIST